MGNLAIANPTSVFFCNQHNALHCTQEYQSSRTQALTVEEELAVAGPALAVKRFAGLGNLEPRGEVFVTLLEPQGNDNWMFNSVRDCSSVTSGYNPLTGQAKRCPRQVGGSGQDAIEFCIHSRGKGAALRESKSNSKLPTSTHTCLLHRRQHGPPSHPSCSSVLPHDRGRHDDCHARPRRLSLPRIANRRAHRHSNADTCASHH